MAAVRLYHWHPSRSTRVAWALEEIGADYETTPLTLDERRGPGHRPRHPLGRVPVLEDERGFLYESGAILLALADRHPDAGLSFPIGTRERELVYQWVLFAVAELEVPVVTARDAREADPARADAALERFGEAARVVERALDGREFLVGDRLTVADIMVADLIAFARRVGALDPFPALAAYADRLFSRPAFERANTPA